MVNFKLFAKKVFGNSPSEMDFFLDCKNGNLNKNKIHDYLLHYRVDINTQFAGKELATTGSDGNTPLMFYLKSLHCELDIVQFMIEQGASINHQSKCGHTPTHSLAYGKSTDKLKILELLKKNGADFDLQNKSGEPCIAPYIRNGSANEVDYILNNSLLTKQILEDCPFPFGRSVLHEIILQISHGFSWRVDEQIKVLELLLQKKFDVNKRTKSAPHNTPLKYLRTFNNRKYNELLNYFQYIEELLIKHGAIDL